jgi:hypothetical protein
VKPKWWIVGYLAALAVTLISPLASGSPDGLERVAESEGFSQLAEKAPYAVIADYAVPGIDNEAVATILAGVIGVTIVYLMVAGGALLLYRLAASRNR